LTETAAALVGDAGPGPEVSAARLALASALAARGDLEGALHRLGAEPQTGEAPGAAELRTELLGRTALNIGEPGRAAAALVGADTTVGKALRREAAWRQGDWAEVARLAGADLAAAGGSGPLDPAGAEAATWLGLAQERLGYADAAVSTAARYAPRIEDRQSTALLRLATVAPPTASGKSLPATMAAFGSAVRVELGALPSLAADSSAGTAVRTASGHSDPAG
jgi:hypothetical protein